MSRAAKAASAPATTVVWSAATTTSTGYDSTQKLIDQFVQLIVSTMTKDGIV